MALSNIAKAILEKSLKTMTTEDLQSESTILTEEVAEGQEVIDLITAELASRVPPTP